jgi:hypothetical protein
VIAINFSLIAILLRVGLNQRQDFLSGLDLNKRNGGTEEKRNAGQSFSYWLSSVSPFLLFIFFLFIFLFFVEIFRIDVSGLWP